MQVVHHLATVLFYICLALTFHKALILRQIPGWTCYIKTPCPWSLPLAEKLIMLQKYTAKFPEMVTSFFHMKTGQYRKSSVTAMNPCWAQSATGWASFSQSLLPCNSLGESWIHWYCTQWAWQISVLYRKFWSKPSSNSTGSGWHKTWARAAGEISHRWCKEVSKQGGRRKVGYVQILEPREGRARGDGRGRF